jgi:hypothetical protein
MKEIYYFAANSDGRCLWGCEHKHRTICSAVACLDSAGGYVIAVENGGIRELNETEEREFQGAKYGTGQQPLESEESQFIHLVVRIKLRPQSSG